MKAGVTAMRARIAAPVAVIAVAVCASGTAGAAQTIQIPVDALLTARSVTTLTGGALVAWTVGVDEGGTGDGFLTAAASKFHKDPPAVKALPDDGRFPADNRHPEVVLHFSNDADPASQQTRPVKGAGEFSFPTPAAQYEKLFLIFTSGEGASALTFTLTYADGTTDVVNQSLPDYYIPIPLTDPVFFNLALDLAKWRQQSTVADAAHHFVDGVEIHPAASKVLTGVKVAKTAAGFLVFWGATGIATSSIDGGSADGDVSLPADAGPEVGGSDASSDSEATTGPDQAVSGGTDGSPPGTGAESGSPPSTEAGSGGEAGGVGVGQPPQVSSTSSGCAVAPSPMAPSAWWLCLLVAGGLLRRRRDE
jgi:MYXO-CTERM domain-containing protein